MASDKKRKQLLKALKKREKNPIQRPVVVKPLTMKAGERHRFTDRNVTVLLAIEKAIISLADQTPAMDDGVVKHALASLIRHGAKAVPSTEMPLSTALQEQLEKRYESMFPANDTATVEVWVDGLRAIFTSVKSQSDFQVGETTYIDSARAFLAKASQAKHS